MVDYDAEGLRTKKIVHCNCRAFYALLLVAAVDFTFVAWSAFDLVCVHKWLTAAKHGCCSSWIWAHIRKSLVLQFSFGSRKASNARFDMTSFYRNKALSNMKRKKPVHEVVGQRRLRSSEGSKIKLDTTDCSLSIHRKSTSVLLSLTWHGPSFLCDSSIPRSAKLITIHSSNIFL